MQNPLACAPHRVMVPAPRRSRRGPWPPRNRPGGRHSSPPTTMAARRACPRRPGHRRGPSPKPTAGTQGTVPHAAPSRRTGVMHRLDLATPRWPPTARPSTAGGRQDPERGSRAPSLRPILTGLKGFPDRSRNRVRGLVPDDRRRSGHVLPLRSLIRSVPRSPWSPECDVFLVAPPSSPVVRSQSRRRSAPCLAHTASPARSGSLMQFPSSRPRSRGLLDTAARRGTDPVLLKLTDRRDRRSGRDVTESRKIPGARPSRRARRCAVDGRSPLERRPDAAMPQQMPRVDHRLDQVKHVLGP